jgi:iron-sulfur cluster assembly accessory protein
VTTDIATDASTAETTPQGESSSEASESNTEDTSAQQAIVLTEQAAKKVKGLIEQEGRDDLNLRIAVQPGGCSGLRYQLFFDDRSMEGDKVSSFGDVRVVVDRMSGPYLKGAVIDFVDTIEKQGFTIDNPNAGGSCACGDSFH